MQNKAMRKSVQDNIILALILVLCAITAILEFLDIQYSKDVLYNRFIKKIVQQTCGSIAGILILHRLNIKLLKKPQNLLYLIPCLIIAIDNFQFSSYFHGEMQLVYTKPMDFILFFGYCMCIGLFEEVVFRGIIFSIIAGYCTKDRKGFLRTYIISSVVFGFAHLFNGFSFGTILQVGYTILTGGLFAFCLIKTKNILCCALVHGVYNFCGLLFDKLQGLGAGVVFDLGTVLTMAIISIAIGVWVLYKVLNYSEEERKELYSCLAISENETVEGTD